MRTVKEVMNSPVKSIKATQNIGEVIAFFKTHNISGAPVVNEQGFAVGLISRSDLMLKGEMKEKEAQEVMTPFVFEVKPEDSLLQVAKSMVEAKVHRIVAIEDGKPVGIVTSLDLVKDYVETLENNA